MRLCYNEPWSWTQLRGGDCLMPQLPCISGRKAVRVFESLGWLQVRQSGSHMILVTSNTREFTRNSGLQVEDWSV